ncbi:MAG TPA: AMP-binding protein [Nocardioidaceae bacterium]|nr:AMP-binding protein [Nocardioidaceae bacterium]
MQAVLDAHADGDLIALTTSGSTGTPRRVVRTTDSWVSSFGHVAELTGLDNRSRLWLPGPLTSTMNLFAAAHAAFVGATTTTSPEGMTHAQLTPAALGRCLDHGTELGGVHVVVAGDRLEPALFERATGAGARVSHYYGAAELSFVAWGSHADNLQPFPEVETFSRDEVLWVRSPYLCHGYDGASGPFRTGPDGFATVGDRGAVIDGIVRVWGRGDAAVTTAGTTVLVADVERVLRPAVAGEVVVVGLPHPELGQVVAAVLTDATSFNAARSAARSELADTHRPRRWFLVTDLPLSPAGKVDRAALVTLLVSPDRAARRLV